MGFGPAPIGLQDEVPRNPPSPQTGGLTVHALFWWSWDGTAWVTQSVVSYWEKPSLTQRQRRLFPCPPPAVQTRPQAPGVDHNRMRALMVAAIDHRRGPMLDRISLQGDLLVALHERELVMQ